MALIRSLMNADVEEDKRQRHSLRRAVILAVFLVTPGLTMFVAWPFLIVWTIPGAILVVLAERWVNHGLAFLLVWPLYYLATCAVLYGLAKLAVGRRPALRGYF